MAYVNDKRVHLSEVNEYSYQMFESVSLTGGGLLALWGNLDRGTEHRSMMFRRVSADGEVLGAVVDIPASGKHEQTQGVMTELADGTIVIGWNDAAQGAANADVMIQHYGQDGVALGDPVMLASHASNNPIAVQSLAGGGYLASWSDGPDARTTLQLFAADGTPLGDPFDVGGWNNGSITALRDGGFVLLVQQLDHTYFLQRFAEDGTAIGDPIRAEYGKLATLDDGRFVLAGDTEYTIYDPRDDVITGTSGDNVIYGRLDGSEVFGVEGNDTLVGANASDILHGGFGDDTVKAMKGDDALFGGDGDDSLDGGRGADTMRGNTGADVFVYKNMRDSGVGAAARDLIIDFETKTDRIDVHQIDADHLHAGRQAFTFIGAAPFTGVGQIRFEQQDGVTLVEADLDGDRQADMTIALQGTIALKVANFILTDPAALPMGAGAGAGHAFASGFSSDVEWPPQLHLA